MFNKNGDVIAYLTDDYHQTIYLWEGRPVAFLDDNGHIYGINGRHLGWYIDEIMYNNNGDRIGFTARTCPAPLGNEAGKYKKYPMDQIQPKWTAPSLPKLSFKLADQDLKDLLKEGQASFSLAGKT